MLRYINTAAGIFKNPAAVISNIAIVMDKQDPVQQYL